MIEPLNLEPPLPYDDQRRWNLMTQGARSIVRRVAEQFQVSERELIGPCRTAHVVRLRWYIWSELRRHNYSTPRIGRWFARDHTTILHGLRMWKASTDLAMALTAFARGVLT